MDIIEVVSKLWPVFLGMLGLVIWAIRLEAKVSYLERHNEADVKKEQAVWDRFDALNSMVTEVLKSVSRLEGRFEGHHVQRD